MKKYLLLFGSLAVAASSAQAAFKCDKKVDPKRVVLFVDANNSPLEINGAAKAACERGETLKTIPEKGGYIDQKGLHTQLKSMADNNISLTSMVVSGHNGGGNVHGSQGGVDKWQVINAFKEAYAKKPELAKDFQSVFMWGCWSMGPSEVSIWRQELPQLKLAAGFIDMGPLNTTTASHSVLTGLLIKEKSLCQEADKAKLKRAIASVENINTTWAAVYTESQCGNNYYYNTEGSAYDRSRGDNPLFTPGNHNVDFDKSFDCKTMAKEIEDNRKKIIEYFYGYKPLPLDGPNSEVRKIYSFVRKAAQCIASDSVLNPDRVVLLRFYDEVKQNFAAVFSDVILEADKEIKHLDSILGADSTQGADMKEFKDYFQKGRADYFATNGSNLKPRSRAEINKMIKYLDGMTKLKMARDPNFSKKLVQIKKLRNAMSTYLFEMNPDCMDFLEWHEVDPKKKPGAYCPV